MDIFNSYVKLPEGIQYVPIFFPNMFNIIFHDFPLIFPVFSLRISYDFPYFPMFGISRPATYGFSFPLLPPGRWKANLIAKCLES